MGQKDAAGKSMNPRSPYRFKFVLGRNMLLAYRRGARYHVGSLEWSKEDAGRLYISFAESLYRGLATRMLRLLVEKLKPASIALTPTSESGVYWTRKLLALSRAGKLPPVTWDYFANYDWEWLGDGKPWSYTRMKKAIEDMVRRNPAPEPSPRRGWWLTPGGDVYEVDEHGHMDFFEENMELFLPPKKRAGLDACIVEAMKRGAIKIIYDKNDEGIMAWGAEVDSGRVIGKRWPQRLTQALLELGARPGERVDVYDWAVDKGFSFYPEIEQNPVTHAVPDEYLPWTRLYRYDRLHPVRDKKLVAQLVASMRKRGWHGPPLVVYGHNTGAAMLLTGVHRAAALDQLADVDSDSGKLNLDRIPVLHVPYGCEKEGDESIAEIKDDWGRADAVRAAEYPVAADVIMVEGWH